MSIVLTSEQEELRTTVRRFLRQVAPMERVRETMGRPGAGDLVIWRRAGAELGLAGATVPERFGGVDMTLLDASYVAEEAGRALALTPFLPTAGLVVPTLVHAPLAPQRCGEALRRIAEEMAVATLAWMAPGARWEAAATGARALEDDGGDWVLNGTLEPVFEIPDATVLVVLAHTPGGEALFLLDDAASGPDSTSLVRTPLPSFDQTRGLGRIDLVDAPAIALTRPGDGRRLLEIALNHARVLLAAEMVGGAQACLDMSVEYAAVREQFGRPIGSFQAIKHKCAEVLVAIEGARAMMRYAAWAAANQHPDLPRVALAAKSAATQAYARAAGENLQIHGGIGVTWEHDAHLYFKRAKASGQLFGDLSGHRRALADLLEI